MTATEVTMEIQGSERNLAESVRSATGHARTEVSEAIGHVPEIAGEVGHRAGRAAERLPGAFGHVRSGAQETVTRLQTMSDSGLRLLAAVSIGFGAGLRLAGAPRLVTLAGLAPAPILGFAILSRPHPARP
ncbi:MAG: hypothetical protein ABSB75_06995 [Candidatus Limnocylindrales bacterium]